MNQPEASQQTKPSYWRKWAGKTPKAKLPKPKISFVIWSFVAAFIAIMAVTLVNKQVPDFFPLFAPFGASSVLLYGAPAAAFSQPRNLIGGHVLSALTGVIMVNLLGNNFLSISLAVAFAIAIMILTKTVHPPAGATAFTAVIASQGNFVWVLSPIFIGTLILLLVALVVNNLAPDRSYPEYWI